MSSGAALVNKAEKERNKLIQERCQQYLTELLKDDDNKYCVDCDAKGPRWASWNLGIFLCIRCAGIHRNLGVHISKVKSVNLDAWTPEQVAYLQQMGNSKARAVYEANLPDNFKRPTSDPHLENFIRSKYEQRKYLAKEWVAPPPPPPAFDIEEERRKEKEKKKTKQTAILKSGNGSSGGSTSGSNSNETNSVPRPHSNPAGTIISASKVPKDSTKSSTGDDLLGISFESSASSSATVTAVSETEDPFDAFVSAQSSGGGAGEKTTNNGNGNVGKDFSSEESDFFNQKVPEKKLDKESILKIFDSSAPPNVTNPNFFNQPLQTALQPNAFSAPGLVPGINPLAFSVTQPSPLVPQAFNGAPLTGGHIQGPNLVGSNPNLTAFPVATNPFLTPAAGTGSTDQFSLPHAKLNQQMGSLTLNPTLTGNNNWSSLASVPIASNSLVDCKTGTSLPSSSSLDRINPFASNSVAGGSLVSSNSASLFSEFVQFPSSNGFAKSDLVSPPATDASSKPATDLSNQGWGFSSTTTTVKANSSTSLGDLWQ